MRKPLFPLCLLVLVLAFCLSSAGWCQSVSSRQQDAVTAALEQAAMEQWPAVRETLEASHAQWQSLQRPLRILTAHSELDEADLLYQQALGFSSGGEPEELHAALLALRRKLELLAQREQLTPESIL